MRICKHLFDPQVPWLSSFDNKINRFKMTKIICNNEDKWKQVNYNTSYIWRLTYLLKSLRMRTMLPMYRASWKILISMLASILTKSLQSRNSSFKDSWNQLLAGKILFTSWTLKTHLLKKGLPLLYVPIVSIICHWRQLNSHSCTNCPWDVGEKLYKQRFHSKWTLSLWVRTIS